MHKYVLKRLLMLIPVIIGVTFVVFFILNLAPGDPAAIILGDQATAEALAMKREELGLNDPIFVRYFHYMRDLLHGSLGVSYKNSIPVWDQVVERLPNTAILACAGILVALLIGIPIGIISAKKQYSLLDNVSMVFALIGVSMPNFWSGLLLVMLFSLTLGWLPSQGMASGFGPMLKSLILPALTLGFNSAAMVARMTRSSMLEVIRQDYISTARAKGDDERTITFQHMLKNALIPIITAVGLQFGNLLGGAMLAETVFSWPGLGRLMVESIKSKDIPMVLGCVIFLATMFTFGESAGRYHLRLCRPANQIALQKGTVSHMHEKNKLENSLATDEKKQRSLWQEAWRRFRKNRMAMIGLAFITFLVVVSITTLVIDMTTHNAVYNEYVVKQDLFNRLKGPSAQHIFGQDEFGRDMLLRMLWGARYSLFTGGIAILLALCAGGILGALSGYYGGTADTIIMRAMDVLLAIPSMLLATAIVAALGTSLWNVMIAIAIAYIPTFARTVRAAVLTVKDQEFIEAARSIGCNNNAIIFQYIIPNALAPIIVQATLGLAGAILSIAGLSFLGSWHSAADTGMGRHGLNARVYIRDAWHVTVIPGLGIMLTILSLNLMGDGLRDAMDPKLKN